MKKAIVLIILFIFCAKPVVFKAYCGGDSTVVVDSTFTVGFLVDVKSCVTALGAKMTFDSTKIIYVSHELYSNFDNEMIALQNGEQGVLSFSFVQLGEDPIPICNVDSLMLFKVKFYVKIVDPDIGLIDFINKQVLYKGKELDNTVWGNFKYNITAAFRAYLKRLQ
ncbi:MAG: hypothetical protein ACFE95_02795 [Candidatus Hodarchaeota archaeon]